jgi:hypothetical protein
MLPTTFPISLWVYRLFFCVATWSPLGQILVLVGMLPLFVGLVALDCSGEVLFHYWL